MGVGRRTQAERTRVTTGELIETALRLFGRDGYAATSIDDIARESGMTKGAVYHHFAGKADVFRAVFVRQEERLAELIAAASTGTDDPREAVRLGALAFLLACAGPEVRRIVLLDGPAVLGWDGVREIEYEHTLKLLRAGLEVAASQGGIAPGDVTVRAHLIFGALCEGGMLIARAGDPAATLTAVLAQAERLLDALI
ncbi:TetR/AcrR family transcriptional regulator [Nonomuraea guangzhouensis]|uniref:TetR/AcrR family transcriptional regulator n=1 Tax=Nonomuraea guangzhouensis TaxID=1291555 RepID=UPI001C5CFFA9|nr:TetR/AcrR family transcriptional regulator [Nonomuraea guangzhouensis]